MFFLTLFNAAIAEQVAEMLGKAKAVGKRSVRAAAAPPLNSRPRQNACPQRGPDLVGGDAARSPVPRLHAGIARQRYSDAQVGAVARDVHRDCAALLNRLFAVRPAVPLEEGRKWKCRPDSIPAGGV